MSEQLDDHASELKLPPAIGESARVAEYVRGVYELIVPTLGEKTRWIPTDPEMPSDPPEGSPITAWNCGNVVAVLCAVTEHLLQGEFPRRRLQPVFGTLQFVNDQGKIESAIPGLHAWFEVRDVEKPREIIKLRVDPTANQAKYRNGVQLPPLITATDEALDECGLIYKGHTTFDDARDYVRYVESYQKDFVRRLDKTGDLLVRAGFPPVWRPDYVSRSPAPRSPVRVGTTARTLGLSAMMG
jgi:hypothetical protein